MGKILFIPVSILGGLLAGFVGKKVFELIWGVFDDAEPPEPEHRDVPWGKLAVALALEGAIFRAIRGIADHAARLSYARATGEWPGEEEPDPS
jgi:hypothetical protein